MSNKNKIESRGRHCAAAAGGRTGKAKMAAGRYTVEMLVMSGSANRDRFSIFSTEAFRAS
jgi:hypothetical protein